MKLKQGIRFNNRIIMNIIKKNRKYLNLEIELIVLIYYILKWKCG